MDRTSSVLTTCAGAAFALIAVTLTAAARPSPADATRIERPTAERPGAAPIILAQGRCYNGHCY
jgi:hypothetical protein